jgi:thiol-disulfide isomerase/thioredoxin
MRFAKRTMLAAVLLAALATAARAGGDWNDAQINWRSYEEGLAAAAKEKKPVCLVFYTDWCPHCTKYSGVFHDAKVVERSKRFVMVRIDKDKNVDLGRKYAGDGDYIPRTFFLSSTGTLDTDLHAPRESYKYFYDESDPAGILAGMDAALAKLH